MGESLALTSQAPAASLQERNRTVREVSVITHRVVRVRSASTLTLAFPQCYSTCCAAPFTGKVRRKRLDTSHSQPIPWSAVAQKAEGSIYIGSTIVNRPRTSFLRIKKDRQCTGTSLCVRFFGLQPTISVRMARQFFSRCKILRTLSNEVTALPRNVLFQSCITIPLIFFFSVRSGALSDLFI